MRTIKIYATERVNHEITLELDDEEFNRLISVMSRGAYDQIAEDYCNDPQSAVDSEFESDDVEIDIKNTSEVFVTLYPEDHKNDN